MNTALYFTYTSVSRCIARHHFRCYRYGRVSDTSYIVLPLDVLSNIISGVTDMGRYHKCSISRCIIRYHFRCCRNGRVLHKTCIVPHKLHIVLPLDVLSNIISGVTDMGRYHKRPISRRTEKYK